MKDYTHTHHIAWSLRTLSARNKVQRSKRNPHNAGHASWLVEGPAEVNSSDEQEASQPSTVETGSTD